MVAVNIEALKKPNSQFTLKILNRYTEARLIDLTRFGGLARRCKIRHCDNKTLICKGHLATFELGLMIANLHHIGNIP
jgi:hypothetical protein